MAVALAVAVSWPSWAHSGTVRVVPERPDARPASVEPPPAAGVAALARFAEARAPDLLSSLLGKAPPPAGLNQHFGIVGPDKTAIGDDTADQPSVWLNQADAARYRRIFALQDDGQWDKADAEIRWLQDRRLIGQVQRQRFLHPTGYHTSYDELRGWLKHYGDQAGAGRLYALAQRRQPAGAPPPPKPAVVERLSGELEVHALWRGVSSAHGRVPRGRTAVGRRPDLAASEPSDDDTFDHYRQLIADARYGDGDAESSDELAKIGGTGSRHASAHWQAGLAAWRQGAAQRAAQHFTAIAADPTASPWRLSAAGYWAGRAFDRMGRSTEARRWFARAARFPRTFYGLIASRRLGSDPGFVWQVPALTLRHIAALAAHPAGRRAIALLQVGQNDLADQELQRLHPHGDLVLTETLVAIADGAGLPGLALQLGNAVRPPSGGTYDALLYPLPHWAPGDGFQVDRALLFAMMRQESRFDPQSISSAGATGVMQLMPETAAVVADGQAFENRRERAQLLDPEVNLSLAQRYLVQLLGTDQIGSNLFHLAAAYNAGPARLMRWVRDQRGTDDPLLFIESIPYAETRGHVQKVLANFWIYRMRLGQGTVSLDAVAHGSWPVYTTLEGVNMQVADGAGQD
ncbi:MAG: transglycosylase SLT domain-containing protein [Azospirillum sp.]|nr:transglycosylase SLT domain-containing protein [Azospirillum sp.]